MLFSPTAQEQAKLQQLKTALQGHLKGNSSSTNPKVRAELKKAAANPEFLFKYLRGRKLNVNRAFDTILYYAEVKCVIYPQHFPEQIPNYVRFAIESRLLNLLSKKDEFGRTYVLYDDSLSMEECSNVLRYAVEGLRNSPEFLDNGLVVLQNLKGFQMRHGKNAASDTKFYFTFWRAFPAKLKAVIYFNTPVYAKLLSSIVKPIVKSKIADRAYISSGLGDLQKRVPLDILPSSLGGKLADDEAIVSVEQFIALVYRRLS